MEHFSTTTLPLRYQPHKYVPQLLGATCDAGKIIWVENMLYYCRVLVQTKYGERFYNAYQLRDIKPPTVPAPYAFERVKCENAWLEGFALAGAAEGLELELPRLAA